MADDEFDAPWLNGLQATVVGALIGAGVWAIVLRLAWRWWAGR